jgi:hypothetical protein
VGVWGSSDSGDAIVGIAKVDGKSGVFGQNTAGGNGIAGNSTTGAGVYGESSQGLAGFFKGNVTVTGDIHLTAGNDCAEDFDIASAEIVEPGTVMVLGVGGVLEPSERAYDNRVAGVVSGAGDYKPGIILDKKKDKSSRRPIALIGKVYCKVDAQYGAVEIGDLLTTSPTLGHAMKATDRDKAFGAIIGKALEALPSGTSLIRMLVALQ